MNSRLVAGLQIGGAQLSIPQNGQSLHPQPLERHDSAGECSRIEP
jgi:hypothetical protein